MSDASQKNPSRPSLRKAAAAWRALPVPRAWIDASGDGEAVSSAALLPSLRAKRLVPFTPSRANLNNSHGYGAC